MAGFGAVGVAESGFEFTAACHGRLKHLAPLDLVHHAPGEFLEHLDIVEAPGARAAVDHAEAANRVAVARDQRDTGIGDDSQFFDGGIELDERVRARILNNQRLARSNDVLAEGVRNGCLSLRRDLLWKADAALEVLSIPVDERYEADRCAQDAAGDACQPVEAASGGESRSPSRCSAATRATFRTMKRSSAGMANLLRPRLS